MLSSAPLFLPSAANWAHCDAGHVLVCYCRKNSGWPKASIAWLGGMCKASCSLLARRPQLARDNFAFVMHHWREFCAMGFFIDGVTMPGTLTTAWQPSIQGLKPSTFNPQPLARCSSALLGHQDYGRLCMTRGARRHGSAWSSPGGPSVR